MAHDERQVREDDKQAAQADAQAALLERSDLDPEIRQVLEDALAHARDAQERLLRVEAEADNRRKRLEREQQDAIRFANEAIVARLLPVLDNLEICAAGASSTRTDELLVALRMTLRELREAFASIGIELFSAERGERFDPKIHEAAVQDAETDLPRNTVVRALQDGARYHERLLRPVRVVVASGRAPDTERATTR